MDATHSHPHTHAGEEEMEAHAHEHTHAHVHPHVHENKKAVLNRLAKASGHLESVRRMIEEDRDCSEVLIQLSAVKSAINNTGKIILQDHISGCIIEAIQTDNQKMIDDLNKAIDQFLK